MPSNSSTDDLQAFDVGIGGFFGPSTEVEWTDRGLRYRHNPHSVVGPGLRGAVDEIVHPNAEAWQTFWHAMHELEVWQWEAQYPDPGVMDGTQWSVHLAKGDREVASTGSNAYPGSEGPESSEIFRRFREAVQALVGDRPV